MRQTVGYDLCFPTEFAVSACIVLDLCNRACACLCDPSNNCRNMKNGVS